MSKMWLLRHKKGRSSHNCCLYQFFKIYFENKILKNENFDHPEKNELFCLQTNLFVKNSFYMTIIHHLTQFHRFKGGICSWSIVNTLSEFFYILRIHRNRNHRSLHDGD